MRRIRDWALTIPFFVVFGITLLVFDIAGRIVRPFSLRAFENVMAALQRTLVALMVMSGTRVEVERSPLVERRGGYALIANHQSLFDIPLIGGLLARNHPKYVAKKELGRWIPSVSLNLRHGGNALIDRGERVGSIAAIKEMARRAQERGVSVVIFPEGTRSRDGTLGRFRRAGARALLSAADRLDVVPVAIDGSWKMLGRNVLPMRFGTTIRIKIGDPIARVAGDAGSAVVAAETWIRDTLSQWRSAPATG